MYFGMRTFSGAWPTATTPIGRHTLFLSPELGPNAYVYVHVYPNPVPSLLVSSLLYPHLRPDRFLNPTDAVNEKKNPL